MPAAAADQTDVGAEPHDLPVMTATRVRSAEPKFVTEPEFDRSGHASTSRQASRRVTPVNANLPIFTAGTRVPPPIQSSPGSSFVSAEIAWTSEKASGMS